MDLRGTSAGAPATTTSSRRVVAAFTGRDLAPDYGSLPTAWNVSDDLVVSDHLPIATEEVRYLGDAVAVVVADGAYRAADAIEAVQVEYEPLPAIVDMAAALAAGAPLVHADKETNRAFTWGFASGDYEAARSRADVIVSRHLSSSGSSPPRWSRARWWPTLLRLPASSRSGRRRRYRTSCAS
jgi:CO/xanthine dehydrogenase Mo-binding subunit